MSSILAANSSVLLISQVPVLVHDDALWVTGLKEHRSGDRTYLEGHVENGYWTLKIQDGYGWCVGSKHKKRSLENAVQIMIEPGVRGDYQEVIHRAREAFKAGLTVVKHDSTIDGELRDQYGSRIPCCANERRNFNGGCDNCGAPCL